ncbi:NAD(P)-dependent dehydrogenase (short-subunit alcohol dehydrogenase family) [Sphingobium xenophagum]|uniref:NAD(P)-dependent dehydrogenase (Short-subunit alcohol dehydrogenase family) n=1 Tax=Sphingobium xenophagum TaxID=121428 RepID=A0ABU1X5P4_SPHXE|nr:SDR family oxidoreductase [Sphingobium xenophagum]MDR7156906.1 NAD(P)-dependent dehydrogenase (short-subunit alcohol dehydrogenase family) [Sphingobium xenophagum]
MAGELAGKVAIVTGGAGGIGRATVELFVAEGAKVVIADVDAAAGEALAAEMGPAAMFQATDVSQREQVQALIDRAVSDFGRLHILFNNAGISCVPFPHFIDDRLDDFQRVMGVNLLGPMLGTQIAARHMKDHGGGVILNNASIAGMLAGQAMMSYRASKAGLIQFSKSAAIDLARYGIRVNCLVPGHIRTNLSSFRAEGAEAEVAAKVDAAIDAVYLSNQPLKRRGQPNDVAQAALFLASDRALQITGITLPVEGGVVAGDPVNHLEEILAARAIALPE